MTTYRRDTEVDILIRGTDSDLSFACIDSIVNTLDMSRAMITYVNNGGQHFEHYHDHVISVDLPFNHGSVRAINIGLSLAMLSGAPYILLLDNDTEIPAGDFTWLDRWLGYLTNDRVAAAGAVSDYASGFQTPLSNPDVFQKAWEADGQNGHGAPPDIPILASFGLLLRKTAVEEVGLFDEIYEPGVCEDYDYIFQLRDAGYETVVAGGVWLHHKGSQTFGQGMNDLLRRNMQVLVDKWGREKLRQFGLEVR